MRRLAIRSALSDKVANESLIVVNDLSLDEPRTKDMLALLDKLPMTKGVRVRTGKSFQREHSEEKEIQYRKPVLMMLPQRDENVVLSARNIPEAKVQHVSSINVVELLKHDYVIMPVKTVRWIEMVFGEGMSAEEASLKIADETSESISEPDSESVSADETSESISESNSESVSADETSESTSESDSEA
jgi:large subunit ribosomal protein L4